MLKLMLSLNFWLEVAKWEDLVPEELLWVEVASWEQCTLLLWEVVLWEESELATLAVLALEAALQSGTLQWELVSLVAIGLQEDLVLDVLDLEVLELDASVALELDVLDWEALLEPADLWEQSTQLLLEEVLSEVVLSEELDMVDLLEDSDMEDLLEDSDMVDLLEESDMVDLLEESDMVDLLEELDMEVL